jgi:hypothetical protein
MNEVEDNRPVIFRAPAFFLKLATILALLAGCLLPNVSRPSISWINYDLNNGLGSPVSSVFSSFHDVPIDGGVLCDALWAAPTAGTIWAGSFGPVMRSVDFGETWKLLDESFRDIGHPGGFLYDSEGYLWLRTPCSVFRMSSDGTTWTQVYSGPSGFTGCAGISSLDLRGDTLWVTCWDTNTLARIDIHTLEVVETYTASEHLVDMLMCANGDIYLSTVSGLAVSHDDGVSFTPFFAWTNPYEPMRNLLEIDSSIFYTAGPRMGRVSFTGDQLWDSGMDNWLYYVGAVSIGDSVWVAGANSTNAVARNVDLENGYAYEDTTFDAKKVGAISVGPGDDVYVSLPGVLAASRDAGATWAFTPFGVSSVDTIVARDGHAWVGLTGGGVAHYRPETGSWKTIIDSYTWGEYTYRTILVASSSEALVSGAPLPTLHKTTDGGETFTEWGWDGLEEIGVYPFSATDMEEDAEGMFYLVASYSPPEAPGAIHLYTSSDRGETWSEPEIVTSTFSSWRSSLALDKWRNCIWVSLQDYPLMRKASDGTWEPDPVISDAHDPCIDDAGTLYVIAQGPDGPGVYKLPVDGPGWSYSAADIDNLCSTQLFVDADRWIWVGTQKGIQLSTDGGESWDAYTKIDGLASDFVTSICIEGSGDGKTIWIGTAAGVSVGSIVP